MDLELCPHFYGHHSSKWSLFGFGQSCEIEIDLDGQDSRKTVEARNGTSKQQKFLVYYNGETVAGKVRILLKKAGSKLEHQGIKIEFIGQIELFHDRGNQLEFLSMVRELAGPGMLNKNTTFPFEFSSVEKPYESYMGTHVKLRYFLRVTIVKRLNDVIKEYEIMVHSLAQYPDINNSLKMEVGIEDCLHIEFEYNKSKYHLKDVIVGKIFFLLVRVKIKQMELQIIKREITGNGPGTYNESTTLAAFEIMDGAPVRGESIPIRLFLNGYDLTPTMRDVNKKFSVKYYLNLVLIDEEDRRYFKQQEIQLYRKSDFKRKQIAQSSLIKQVKQQVGTRGLVAPAHAPTAVAAAAAAEAGGVRDANAPTPTPAPAHAGDELEDDEEDDDYEES